MRDDAEAWVRRFRPVLWELLSERRRKLAALESSLEQIYKEWAEDEDEDEASVAEPEPTPAPKAPPAKKPKPRPAPKKPKAPEEPEDFFEVCSVEEIGVPSMYMCNRLRLRAMSLPCGKREECFKPYRCGHLPYDAEYEAPPSRSFGGF